MGNQTAADVALQKALHANTNDFDVVSAQVRISKSRMKSDDTVKFISDYVRKHPKDLSALVLRSEIWEILGKRQEVIADLTVVVKLAPNHTFALQKLAEAYQKEKDYKVAVKTLNTLLAMELNPSSEIIASNSLAKCLESMGDLQGALKAREHIVDVEQKINDYDLSRGNVKNLGSGFAKDAVEMCRLEIALKKYASAAQKLTSILTVIPENTNARELRARAYEGVGRWNDALTDWDRLVNKQSSFPKWYECRAKAYEKLGKRDDARRDLETAKKLSVDP
jgi:tetratricopeptide (TPR) repeat protein